MASCLNCNKSMSKKSRTGFCLICYKNNFDEEKIKLWKETGKTGCVLSSTLRNCIRDYIFDKQNKLCAICGINNIWNDLEIKFILDHIDGNASNDYENNLRLICPNCDSQLDTYKSKNRNSARKYRKTK